jgi:sugar lactone lactonase YvrE/alpha-beta hydrolase superfamily lysophospholipase
MIRLFLFLFVVGALASSPVDRQSPLKKVDGEFVLADGPCWTGWSLVIPDVKGGKIYRYTPTQNKLSTLVEAPRISASFFNHERLYFSDNGKSQIAWLDGNTLIRIAGQDPAAKPPARPNDLVVGVHGGIYYTLTRQGQVIYIPPDGSQRVAVEQINTPNGITMSPDGKTLYVASYVPKKIWAYTVGDDGNCSNGHILANMDEGPDRGADGMCIDRAGNVYCAGPAHIWIWSPGGALLDKIETPARPINCTFGGPVLDQLYISCFDGVYQQQMRILGNPASPATVARPVRGKAKPSTVLPASVTPHFDTVFTHYGKRKLLADVFVPDAKGPLPAVVVVHGGGWLKGDKNKFRALAIGLAARGFVTMAIEYRLGGEARFPAGIHDCNAAVRWLRANSASYKVDPDRIGAVGGSAGGQLVGLMATGSDNPKLQGEGAHPSQSSRLQAAIVMAGPMEMTSGSVAERSRSPDTHSNSNIWLGKTVDEAPALYRLADAHLHISKDDPPLLFMVGEHDKPERNQPSRERLAALGVWTGLKVYADGKHGCWNQLPWFSNMVGDMEAFFKEKL